MLNTDHWIYDSKWFFELLFQRKLSFIRVYNHWQVIRQVFWPIAGHMMKSFLLWAKKFEIWVSCLENGTLRSFCLNDFSVDFSNCNCTSTLLYLLPYRICNYWQFVVENTGIQNCRTDFRLSVSMTRWRCLPNKGTFMSRSSTLENSFCFKYGLKVFQFFTKLLNLLPEA